MVELDSLGNDPAYGNEESSQDGQALELRVKIAMRTAARCLTDGTVVS